MGVVGSFSITSQILNISLDLGQPSLIQGVRYDRSSNKIVDNITGKELFNLSDPSVLNVGEGRVLIRKASMDVSCVYQINENNTITRLSHLYINQEKGRDIIIDKNNKSYYNVLKNLPSEYTKGVFVNLNGTFELLDKVNWDNIFTEE